MKLHSVFIHFQWCKLTCSRQYKQRHRAILSSTTNANRCTCRTFLHIKKKETPFFMWKNTGSHCRCLLYRRLKMACNVGHKYILYSYLLTKYHNDWMIVIKNELWPYYEYQNNVFCSAKPFLFYKTIFVLSKTYANKHQQRNVFHFRQLDTISDLDYSNAQFTTIQCTCTELENPDNFSRILKGYENSLSEKRQLT